MFELLSEVDFKFNTQLSVSLKALHYSFVFIPSLPKQKVHVLPFLHHILHLVSFDEWYNRHKCFRAKFFPYRTVGLKQTTFVLSKIIFNSAGGPETNLIENLPQQPHQLMSPQRTLSTHF